MIGIRFPEGPRSFFSSGFSKSAAGPAEPLTKLALVVFPRGWKGCCVSIMPKVQMRGGKSSFPHKLLWPSDNISTGQLYHFTGTQNFRNLSAQKFA